MCEISISNIIYFDSRQSRCLYELIISCVQYMVAYQTLSLSFFVLFSSLPLFQCVACVCFFLFFFRSSFIKFPLFFMNKVFSMKYIQLNWRRSAEKEQNFCGQIQLFIERTHAVWIFHICRYFRNVCPCFIFQFAQVRFVRMQKFAFEMKTHVNFQNV